MKKTRRIVLLGLVAGLVTHLGYVGLVGPCTSKSLDCQLVWMKSELHLTDAQFARIRAIHEHSSERLKALATQVTRMRAELAAFERERKTNDEVDFLAFARYVDQRRAIDRKCIESARHLVSASADVMDPQQRNRYLGIVEPALSLPASLRLQ